MLGVIGDLVQDIVIWLEEEIRPATDTQSTITMTRGGSAANVAAFAAPRYPTRFIGCVGEEDLGGFVVTRELSSHGVDVRVQQQGKTGMIVVLIDARGERTMFPSRGASGLIERVDDAWLEGIEILHVTGYSLQEEPSATSVLDAAARVKAAGGRVSFDVSSTGMIDLYGIDRFTTLVGRLAPDFVSANRDECALLRLVAADGGPGEGLARLGEAVLLARAGTDPTRVFRAGSLEATVPVQPAPVVRDMTGAGDAFNAGFLSAVLGGRGDENNLVPAVEAAHALARRVLAHPGASEGVDADMNDPSHSMTEPENGSGPGTAPPTALPASTRK